MFNKIAAMFRKPSAKQLAQIELEESERFLLTYQTQSEYSAKMVEFYKQKVKRLREHVRSDPEN